MWVIDGTGTGTEGSTIGFYNGYIYAYTESTGFTFPFTVSDYRPNALITKFTASGLLFFPIKIEGFLISIIGKGLVTVSLPGYDPKKTTVTKVSDNFTVEPALNK